MKAKRTLALILSGLMLSTSLLSAVAQAAVVSTGDVIQAETNRMTRDQLVQMLQKRKATESLQAMGIDPAMVQHRVQHMTADELQAFNQQVSKMEAGGDALGVVVLVFLILIVLDLLGATDIFPAIKPINSK